MTANVYNPYVARVHVVAALHDDAINGKDEPFRPVSFLSLKPLGFNLPDEILGHEKLTLLASSGRPTLRNMIQYANSNLKADSVMVSISYFSPPFFSVPLCILLRFLLDAYFVLKSTRVCRAVVIGGKALKPSTISQLYR